MTFKNSAYQKKHEELCKSYHDLLGRDFENDFAEYQKAGSPPIPKSASAEEAFERWKKANYPDEPRKRKMGKPKQKRKPAKRCKCK